MYNRPLKMASELTERTFMNPIVDFLFEGRMLNPVTTVIPTHGG